MTINHLLPVTRQGLRAFCEHFHGHASVLDSGAAEQWAWLTFQLSQAPDKEEWFPSGKWATIQRIQDLLAMEAKESLEAAVSRGLREL